MVSPSPYLQRRIQNTDNIVKANKAHLVNGLSSKYPNDYLMLDKHSNLMTKKPWIESTNKYASSIQSLAITGGDKVLVICVDFSDKPYTIPISTIQNRFFGTSGKTMRNFYNEVSHGLYIPDGIVVGWYRVPQTYAYYRDDPITAGCDYGIGHYPNNTQRLYEDALTMLDNDPNITNSTLSGLDIDGDGNLERIFVVHAGGEAAYGGDCNEIWAVRWGISPVTIKGKTFSGFVITSEYIDVYTDPQRSGVDCHEFGHTLGLPDLYDYSGNTNGVGKWSLMASGSWGTDYGITPSHLDAWSKIQFGWMDTMTNQVGSISLNCVENYNTALIYTTSDPNEYFIIENRQKIGFDAYLPGSGLLIWHINDNVDQYSNINCHTVSLVQADGLNDLEKKTNDGDSGDPYPGTTNNRSFGTSTIPNSLLCNNSILNILIDSISNSTCTMSFNSTLTIGSARFHTTPTGADIYFGTVYKGTTDVVTGILGIDDIPVGTVNYAIKKVGYFDYVGSIDIIANTITYKLVTMTLVASATNVTVFPITCTSPCTPTVSATWINNGTVSGSFYPAINIDGLRIPFTTPEVLVTISPGVPLTKNFTTPSLEIGTHTICPDPN